MMDDTKFDGLNKTPVDTELDQKQQELDEIIEQQETEHFELKINSRRDERVLAFYLVYGIDRFDYSIPLETAIENFEAGFAVDASKRDFALSLARGAIDQREELDEKLKPFLKNWTLERLGCCTKLILRLSLWELSQPKAISSIIINEAVELAKMFAEKDAYKFINGILDEMAQQLYPDSIVSDPKDSDQKDSEI